MLSALTKTPSKPTAAAPRVDSTFLSITLGESRQTVRILNIPPITSPVHDKARAFDYFTSQLLPLRHVVPTPELIATFASHFPTNTMSAETEASAIGNLTLRKLFCVDNLQGRAFLNSRGEEVPFKEEHIDNRPPDLYYYRFIATVDPLTVDQRLSSMKPFTIEFDLPLPQSSNPANTALAGDKTQQNLLAALNAAGNATPAAGGAQPITTTTPAHDGTVDETTNVTTPVISKWATTPKMFKALQHHHPGSKSAGITYHGPIDFLENQVTFNLIWPNPTPISLVPNKNGVPTINSVTDDIWKYINECRLMIFSLILRMDYVGSAVEHDQCSIEDIGNQLRRFTLSYTYRGKLRQSTPDLIFSRYLDLLPMLPEANDTWGFNLVNLFWSAMTSTIREAILDKGYALPPYANMRSKTQQKMHLVALRAVA